MRVDEHTIYFDESPVFYRSAEASGMPKLYLHGIPTSSDDWVEVLGRTGGFAPDMIGFGRSGKGGHLDYSLDGLVEFVERFLASVGIETVQIVGHDWGAAVGLALAAKRPERVRRLVLCNAPPLLEGFEWPRLVRLWRTRLVGELVMGATTRTVLARMLRRGSVRPDAWPDGRVTAVWRQFDQGTQRAILRLVRSVPDNMLGGSGPHAPGERGGGRGEPHGPGGRGGERGEPHGPGGRGGGWDLPPALVIWGESDPWYPPALGEAYATWLPNAELERVAGAGHWPWLDRPEVVERVAALLEG